MKDTQSKPGESTQKLLSVVVPMFNEQDNIGPLFEELAQVTRQLSNIGVEYILVDDGSSDNTFLVSKKLCEEHSGVTVLRFARNYGGHAAIAAGLAAARGDCVVFIAADLQDPPSLIPEMLKHWQAGFRIVFAARTYVEKQPLSERFFSQCFWYLFNLVAAYPLPTRGVDFAMMDRIVVDIVKSQAHLRIPIFSHLVETGFPCAVVKYVKRPRASGESGWTLHKKFSYAFQTIFISIKTFRTISALALLTCVVSLVSFLIGNQEMHLLQAWSLEVICLHLVVLAVITLLLILAEHMNLRLKGLEGSPRFILSEVVSQNDEALKRGTSENSPHSAKTLDP